MKKIQAIFIGLFLTISSVANAVIVDNDEFTTDTISNLDWLDLEFTLRKTYFDIERLIINDPELDSLLGINSATTEKWSIASSQQFDALILNYTGLSVTNVINSTVPNLLDGLIGMLGKTYESPTSRESIYGSRGMIKFENQQNSLYTVKTLDTSRGTQILPNIGTDLLQNGNSSRPDVGVYLVRTSQYILPSSITSVPEPETYAMFLAGLGLLGFAKRRKH